MGEIDFGGLPGGTAKMGAEGVELIGDQMFYNSPYPEERFYQCNECEGNRFAPSGVDVQGVDQVRRHQKMLELYTRA